MSAGLQGQDSFNKHLQNGHSNLVLRHFFEPEHPSSPTCRHDSLGPSHSSKGPCPILPRQPQTRSSRNGVFVPTTRGIQATYIGEILKGRICSLVTRSSRNCSPESSSCFPVVSQLGNCACLPLPGSMAVRGRKPQGARRKSMWTDNPNFDPHWDTLWWGRKATDVTLALRMPPPAHCGKPPPYQPDKARSNTNDCPDFEWHAYFPDPTAKKPKPDSKPASPTPSAKTACPLLSKPASPAPSSQHASQPCTSPASSSKPASPAAPSCSQRVTPASQPSTSPPCSKPASPASSRGAPASQPSCTSAASSKPASPASSRKP